MGRCRLSKRKRLRRHEEGGARMSDLRVEIIDQGNGQQLLCPVCGFHCTHARDARAIVTNAGEKRIDLRLRFSCEQGHEFEIVFHQHEGETFVSAVQPMRQKGARQ